MPAAKYTEAQRAEALALYETDGPTAVEKKLGIPKNTVAGWARKIGTRTVRTAKTNAATEAKVADNKAVRAMIATKTLDVAKLAADLVEARLTEAPHDITAKDLATIHGIFVDKHAVLVKMDASNTESAAAVDKWLDMMTGGLRGGSPAGG